MRPSARAADEPRPIQITRQFTKHAEGAVLVEFGDTRVICTASVEERVPPFLKGKGRGWVTAEYGMLPRATHTRMQREASRGRQEGRTMEIQRLIGRALRAVMDLEALGERTITVDCDVIQADGGTRTAAITGSYVALHQCFTKMLKDNLIEQMPLLTEVAAVSCGMYQGVAVLDLDYPEDSAAETDANFVITGTGELCEIQATAEHKPFNEEQFLRLLRLARLGVEELVRLQRQAVAA